MKFFDKIFGNNKKTAKKELVDDVSDDQILSNDIYLNYTGKWKCEEKGLFFDINKNLFSVTKNGEIICNGKWKYEAIGKSVFGVPDEKNIIWEYEFLFLGENLIEAHLPGEDEVIDEYVRAS